VANPAQAERICTEFEQAWRAETGPRIEDWLAGVASGERALLVRELLEIELHARQQRGDWPALEDYAERFPESREMLAELFAKWVRRRLGDYDILREIGHGGMGIVYQAQHRLLNQVVALKVLPDSTLGDRQAVRRFQREMLSLGGLNHPNIVRALNAGEERGVHYLVMEFVDGLDFRELVSQHGCLSPAAACELIRQAAVGLQYIHERDLVHRDVKPANLMLARCGTVKILDLGLARLEAVPQSREGTLPGVPMGTIDYMAPEQWVDATMVDIRADIYSLGCTLFFLLTGKPPPVTDEGDTSLRWKAKARRTHPPVASLRPDCPPDLDKILELMLAEVPDERFDTPDEVADAVGVFAAPESVAALASAGHRVAGEGRSGPDVKPGSATARHPSVSKWFRPGRVPSRFAKGARKRLGWGGEAAGAGAILLALLVLWLALRIHGGGGSRLEVPQEEDLARRLPSAAELCALPGLNGRWWFDETPWLLPCVRDMLARDGPMAASAEVPKSDGLRDARWLWDPNIGAVQQRLASLTRAGRGKLPLAEAALVEDMLTISQQDVADEQLAVRLQAALDRFVRATEASGAWSAAALHARAVLQHKIATINNALAFAEQAAESYQAALAAYDPQDGIARALRARCLVDAGQLQALVFRDYAQARRDYREARSPATVPLLLQAEAWLNEGIASAVANRDTAGKYADASQALTQAQQLLQDAEPGKLNHPLLAHVHERLAWILMDQWNVRKASQEFEEARNIRFDNYWKSKNDFAQIFVFHNDHGQAMAERYCGDERLARAKYDLVIGEIEKALAKADAKSERPGWQRFRRDLRERWSNSCERRADCELYGGAASGVAVDLKEAARLYAVAREQADDPAVQIAMACKRSLVLALDGQVAEARQELHQTAVTGQAVIGVQEERVRLLRTLAEAAVRLKGDDEEAGLAALRAFLKQFDLDPNYPDRHRRETQELQLLAAELLIATECRRQQADAALADLAHLDRLIVAFPYRDQMLPYLRRYYDLAVEVVAERDPERAAAYILASRDQRPVPDAALLLFHFTADRGWAIVRPRDAAAVSYPFDFGRKSLRQTVADAQPVKLPQDLVALVERERTAGRGVAVFWDDARCWAKAENAISKADWPFAGQLDFADLIEPPSGPPSAETSGVEKRE